MIYALRSSGTIERLFNSLCGKKNIFALKKNGTTYRVTATQQWDPQCHVIGDFRPAEPLKSLFFKPREALGACLDDTSPTHIQERIAVGVKNCDLSSLQIHDYVFLKNDPVDPYYKAAREKTIIVSADCSSPCDVCFCTAVGEQPYPKQGFDINISPLPGGRYLIETASPKGEKAIQSAKDQLEPADQALIRQRDTQREQVAKRVTEQAARKGLEPGIDYQKTVRASEEKPLWGEYAQTCVECGACNFVCCTCHCFLIADGFDDRKQAVRLKQWDSCLYKNFARVAGGANPRRHRAERLYNRFDKKFVFFPTVLKTYACDGCGRCIEACTGKIDIREVLKKAIDETKSV